VGLFYLGQTLPSLTTQGKIRGAGVVEKAKWILPLSEISLVRLDTSFLWTVTKSSRVSVLLLWRWRLGSCDISCAEGGEIVDDDFFVIIVWDGGREF
jgi:hypothetical protein